MVHIFGHDPFKEWYLSQACRSRGCQWHAHISRQMCLETHCQFEFSFIGPVWAVGAVDKKIQNRPNYAAFEAIFFMFSWPKWMKKKIEFFSALESYIISHCSYQWIIMHEKYGLPNSNGFQLKWRFGTDDNWKNENPGGRFGAKQHCQFSPFGPIF